MRQKSAKLVLQSVKIAGVPITITPKNELLNFISHKLKNTNIIIFTPNPEFIVEANKDPKFNEILQKANILIPDGIGIRLAIKLLHNLNINRITGREFLLDLFSAANSQKLKIFIIGTNDQVISKTIKKMHTQYPQIKILADKGPIYTKQAIPKTQKDKIYHQRLLDQIKTFRPDYIFVALGAPKQEYWINTYLNNINFKLAMGIGGSLDYFSGSKAVSPNFISTIGLEWLWRLAHEPKRFFRIINAVFIFPLIIFKHKLSSYIP